MPDHAPAYRRPDAVLLPSNHLKGGTWQARADEMKRDLQPSLVEDPTTQYVHGAKDAFTSMIFARTDPQQSMMFPHGHAREGEGRYDWFFAEKGEDGKYVAVMPCGQPTDWGRVLVGFLKEGAAETVGFAITQDQADLDARIAAFKASGGIHSAMRKLEAGEVI